MVGWLVCPSLDSTCSVQFSSQPWKRMFEFPLIFWGCEELIHGSLGHPKKDFEKAGHPYNPASPPSLHILFFLPPLSLVSLSGITQSQGILGFVDHTGILLVCPLGTMPQGEEYIHHHTGVSWTPRPSHFLFVYNNCEAPLFIQGLMYSTLSPFFIMHKNRINLATRAWTVTQSVFDAQDVTGEENSAFWDVMVGCADEGQVSLKKIKLYISGNWILQGPEGLPCMT